MLQEKNIQKNSLHRNLPQPLITHHAPDIYKFRGYSRKSQNHSKHCLCCQNIQPNLRKISLVNFFKIWTFIGQIWNSIDQWFQCIFEWAVFIGRFWGGGFINLWNIGQLRTTTVIKRFLEFRGRHQGML